MSNQPPPDNNKTSTAGGLFSNLAGSASGSLFSGSPPPAGGGLFGSGSPAAPSSGGMFSPSGNSATPSLFGAPKAENGKKEEGKREGPVGGLFGSGPNQSGALMSGSLSSPSGTDKPSLNDSRSNADSPEPPKSASSMFASAGPSSPSPAPSFLSKGDANMTGSLFGGTSMFGAPKKEEDKKDETSTSPTVPKTSQPATGLFGGFAPVKQDQAKPEAPKTTTEAPFLKKSDPTPLFGANPVSLEASKTASFPKADDKKYETPSLVTGSVDRSMFAPQKPKASSQKSEEPKPEQNKPVQQKSESAPSLFSSVQSFGDPSKKTEAKAAEVTVATKPAEEVKSFFGGNAPPPLNLGNLLPKADKSEGSDKSQVQTPLFGGMSAGIFSATTGVNANKQTKPAQSSKSVDQSFTKTKSEDKPAADKTTPEVPNSLFSGQAFAKEKSKEPEKQGATEAAPIPYSFGRDRNKQPQAASTSEGATISQHKPGPVSEGTDKPSTMKTSDPQKSTIDESKAPMTTQTTAGGTQGTSPTQQIPTASEGVGTGRQFSSIIRQRQAAGREILDFKTLHQQSRQQSFGTFVSEYKSKIISSVKGYFSFRVKPYQLPKAPQNVSEREKFTFDFTHLLLKIIGLEQNSYDLLSLFVNRVIKEEHYDQKLFTSEGKFVIAYFKQNDIYRLTSNNEISLNEHNSKQLTLLVEKFINKWNVERIMFLNFLFKFPDLFRPPSDLFTFLFQTLMRVQWRVVEDAPDSCHTFLADYDVLLCKKVSELLEHYNKKLNSYKLIESAHVKVIIQMVQKNQKEELVPLCLKVLLKSIPLKNPSQIKTQILNTIKETKSLPLMPLRAITYKLARRSNQFFPSAQDLYLYVKGDEWADWLDLYLHSSQNEVIEQNPDEPDIVTKSICSLSGPVLIEKLLTSKKGISSFFSMLREENLVGLYYHILEACLYNEQSIKQIDEFYFKKMYFSLEYQEILEYVTKFDRKIEEPHEQNEQGFSSVFEAKLSLLMRMLEIEPDRLQQIEMFLFNPGQTKFKRRQGEARVREGYKLIHLLIDVINIASMKAVRTALIGRVFKLLANLLRSRKTEPIVLSCMNINKPSFFFLEQPLESSTLDSLNDMLQLAISDNYIYELVIGYDAFKDQEMTGEKLYPFRYQDGQYTRQLDYMVHTGQKDRSHFSIYWFNQLLNVLKKQRFNPYLIGKLLSKLHVIPHYESANQHQGAYRYHQQQEFLPPVLESIVGCLNSQSVWESIKQVLDFRVAKNDGKHVLVNKCTASQDTPEAHRLVFYTLQLLNTILELNSLVESKEGVCGSHLVIRSLTAIRMVNRLNLNSLFSSSASKHYLLLSVLSNVQSGQPFYNHSRKSHPWQAEEMLAGEVDYNQILTYINKNRNSLDFEQAYNFMKKPNSILYDNQDNSTTLSLKVVNQLISLYGDYSIEYSLTSFLGLSQEEKEQMRQHVIDHLGQVLIGYAAEEDYQLAKVRVIQFLYDLKHCSSDNHLNSGLADRIFNRLISQVKPTPRDTRYISILLDYLNKQTAQDGSKLLPYAEQMLAPILAGFSFRHSFLGDYRQIKDTQQLTVLLNNYNTRKYALSNLNQMRRIIEERCLLEIGMQIEYLTHSIGILARGVISRKASSSLVTCLNEMGNLIAFGNLAHLVQDIPFDCNQLTVSPVSAQPRLFLRDPNDFYLSQKYSNWEQHSSDLLLQVQDYQKNNLIEWFIQKSIGLSEAITHYLQLTLTINERLYSNTFLSFETQRADVARTELFSHLPPGKYSLRAVQIFGRSGQEAAEVVTGIGDSMLNRLITSMVQLQHGAALSQYQERHLKEEMVIVNFCISWLHNHERRTSLGAKSLVGKIARNYQVLIPQSKHLSIMGQALTLFIIAVMQDKHSFEGEATSQLHDLVHALATRYSDELTHRGEQTELGLLVQEGCGLLLVLPPSYNASSLVQSIVNVWCKQTNQQYFYNESRLVMSLCESHPEEVVRCQPLNSCAFLNKLPNQIYKYLQGERTWEGLVWIWGLKIASLLSSHQQSVLIVNEVSNFISKHKDKIVSILSVNESQLTKGHVEELEATLQLLIGLFEHELWVSFHRPLFEEFTHILSHKTIKTFVQFSQGHSSFHAQSPNCKTLSQIKAEGDLDYTGLNILGDMSHENMFQFECKIKLNQCLKKYSVAMTRAFQVSHYIEQLFDSKGIQELSYFNAFWDTFNKNLGCLLNYSQKQFKRWLALKQLTPTLKLLNECIQAPHTYVDNGYLGSVMELPRSQEELMEDLYQLGYLLAELSTVHLLKQQLYIRKYNSLMHTHLDKLAKKVRDHISSMDNEKRRVGDGADRVVPQNCFWQLRDILQRKLVK